MVKSRTNGRSAGGARKSRRWPWVLFLIAVILVTVGWMYRTPITGYAGAGAAYSARVACSCRFVAGRSMDDCKKDKLPGMEFVSLKDDVDAKSVTARFPLIVSETATYRKGYGCVMDEWRD